MDKRKVQKQFKKRKTKIAENCSSVPRVTVSANIFHVMFWNIVYSFLGYTFSSNFVEVSVFLTKLSYEEIDQQQAYSIFALLSE